MTATLRGTRQDRAAGVLLGTACGDALGAGYEFGPPLADEVGIGMVGGGPIGWAPGEWTDDTSMALAIAEITATGADLRSRSAQDALAARWAGWAREAPDVGIQTRAVFSAAGANPSAVDLAQAAVVVHERRGFSGGNGSLMRTAPLALAHLHDPEGLSDAVRTVSALTHRDPEAGEACLLWCLAIRHAVLQGTFAGLGLALERLPSDRATVWAQRIAEAEAHPPAYFTNNGWVVHALQAAWSAISRTAIPDEDPANGAFPAQHLRLALESAVRGGHDTDTVAAIAGGLLGAVWGASAVPLSWLRVVHGWPGYRARDLVRLGPLTARQGHADEADWPAAPEFDYSGYGAAPALVQHPHDDRVWLGGVQALRDPPEGVDAVVSLCRLGAREVPAPGIAASDHVEVWLIDSADSGVNPHLDHVLTQAAETLASLRSEGRTVLLHCVGAQSRTPTVATLYSARHLGVPLETALGQVTAALPDADPNPAFRAALRRLAPRGESQGRGAL